MNLAGIDEPFLVVLVGASGAGKSTWAASRFRASEVVSSDDLRGVVGTGPHDVDASVDAFAALDLVVAARLRRHLTTVVDTLGLDAARRRDCLALARSAGMPAIAVLLVTDPALCRQRNRDRQRPVPARVLTAQLRRMAEAAVEVETEGWAAVVRLATAGTVSATGSPSESAASGAVPVQAAGPLRFVLQLSRFPWDRDPASWLASVALAADAAGFHGLALMDHLIQIPQVGRAWDPIPEPWVTLGLLAGLPTSLHLGTLVSPASLHAPGRLAKAAATLSALTGGRVFVGVGAGWWEREHRAFGFDFAPAAERVDELARCIETMRALWRPGTKAYDGALVSLPETTCYPRPVGDIEIIVGGRGARVLKVAAALGDACNVPAEPAQITRAVAAMGGKAVTVLDLPLVGDDRDHAADLVERLRGRIAPVDFARRHHAGTAAEHVARYRGLAEQGVSTVFVAPPDLAGPDQVARFAPVIAAFAN